MSSGASDTRGRSTRRADHDSDSRPDPPPRRLTSAPRPRSTGHPRYKGRHFKLPKRAQLELRLREPRHWGGTRERAGRKPRGRQAEIRHASRAAFRKLPAHVTLRLRPDQPSLRTVSIAHEIETAFRASCARPGFRLVHYSLQGNHAHLIVEAIDRNALGRGMMAIASRLARAVNRVTGRHGPVLADRYHSRTLSTPRECHRALRYVLLNSRRHTAPRSAASAYLDPASSARWFDGWKYHDIPGPPPRGVGLRRDPSSSQQRPGRRR